MNAVAGSSRARASPATATAAGRQPSELMSAEQSGLMTAPATPEAESANPSAKPVRSWNQLLMTMVAGTVIRPPLATP